MSNQPPITDEQQLAILADRLNIELHPRKPKLDYEQAVASGHALENADGTIVLRLHHPIEIGGEKVSRVTMHRVRVRQLRAAQQGPNTSLPDLATELAEPDVFNDLERSIDADLFIAAAGHQLGKFLGDGPQPTRGPASSESSGSSAGTSGSPRLI